MTGCAACGTTSSFCDLILPAKKGMLNRGMTTSGLGFLLRAWAGSCPPTPETSQATAIHLRDVARDSSRDGDFRVVIRVGERLGDYAQIRTNVALTGRVAVRTGVVMRAPIGSQTAGNPKHLATDQNAPTSTGLFSPGRSARIVRTGSTSSGRYTTAPRMQSRAIGWST